MSTVTRSFNLDELHIDEVYEYYDQPCLFTAKTNSDQIFIVVFIDQTESSTIWLYAPISSTRLNTLKAKEIDLKSAFSQTEDNFVYKVAIPRNNSNAQIEEVACQDLNDDQLPLAGEFLDLVDYSSLVTTNKFLLAQEIKSQGAIDRNLSGALLSGADLSGALLSGADLSGADLSGALLSGADLRRANLSGANLSGANLSDANLSDALLRRALLRRANLRRADLRRANLIGADLRRADLSGADLSGALLIRTDLSDALLIRALLIRASLSGASLSGADLSGANLSDADLSDADLSDADLRRANLSGAVVEKAKFGDDSGLSEEMKLDLKQRGAIFEDSPGDRSGVLSRR